MRSQLRSLDNLYGVSCVNGSFRMAVGISVNRSGNRIVLAEAWNGARWRVVRSAETGPPAPDSSGDRAC